MNLDNIGVSTIKDSTAFKKIQFFSKTNPSNLFNVKSDFQNSFQKVNNLYINDLDLNNSYTYGMDRQHTYTSLSTTLPNFNTRLDSNSINKFFNYNFNYNLNNSNNLDINRLNYLPNNNQVSEGFINNIFKLTSNNIFTPKGNLDFSTFLQIPNVISVLGAENDSKQYSNNFKFLLNLKHKKKSIYNLNYLNSNTYSNELLSSNFNLNNFSNLLYNSENTLKFKDYKSSNAQFLGSEKTVRLLSNLNSNLYKWNISASPNLPTTISNNLNSYGKSQDYIYSSSSMN
jgi:hypothetical protein